MYVKVITRQKCVIVWDSVELLDMAHCNCMLIYALEILLLIFRTKKQTNERMNKLTN